MIEPITNTIVKYVKGLLSKHSKFTGSLQLHFKDGKLKEFKETKRTKIEEGN